MHRSGTSAVAGLLVRLGLQGPSTLMAPNDANPSGYWESAPIAAHNERLLRSAGTAWHSWAPIDSGWEASATGRELGAELQAIIAREFGSSSLFVVKDPRLCRIVPFWLQHLATADIDSTSILVVRDPAEVAGSLAIRDDLPTELAVLMWLRHMLDAERSTRRTQRSFVAYRDLLEDWRRVVDRVSRDIDVEWPYAPETAAADVERFLHPELRHHTGSVTELDLGSPLGEWARRASDAFHQLAADARPSSGDAFQELDDIRGELDHVAAVFGRGDERLVHALLTRLEHSEIEHGALRSHISTVDGEHAALNQHASALERELTTLHQHAAALGHDLATLHKHAAALQADRDAHAERAQAAALEVTALRDRVAELEATVTDLRGECGHLRETKEQLGRERDALAQSLASARQRVNELLASASWRVTAPGRGLLRLVGRVLPIGSTPRDE
jgi:hypothetical protein